MLLVVNWLVASQTERSNNPYLGIIHSNFAFLTTNTAITVNNTSHYF